MVELIAIAKTNKTGKLSTFSGKSNEALNNLLKKCKRVAEYNNWDSDELMKAIPLSLTELVDIFYQSLAESIRRNFK